MVQPYGLETKEMLLLKQKSFWWMF